MKCCDYHKGFLGSIRFCLMSVCDYVARKVASLAYYFDGGEWP